jgi:hypothetical protein
MKTYTIFGLTLVTGDKDGKVAKLAAGTHFLTAYGNKRGGKRKVARVADMQTTGTDHTFNEEKVMEAMAGMEDKPTVLPQTEPRDTCEHGRGMTDYCLPCGRVNGQEASHVSD